MIEIYEGITYGENFKITPIRKIIEKLFALGQKLRDERLDLMQGLVKIIINILYVVQIRKDVNEIYKCEIL